MTAGEQGKPVLKVRGAGEDPRPAMYGKIAAVHRSVRETIWRARTANAPVQPQPSLIFHSEEVGAFLAEELLKLSATVETQTKAIVSLRAMLEAQAVSLTLLEGPRSPATEVGA